MKLNKVKKILVILLPILITSCNKKETLESNTYKDLDARKMLFFNLENIKRNEEDKISNYVNKINYKYNKYGEITNKTYRSEFNIYSNYLENTDITILGDEDSNKCIYKHAIKNGYLYTYILENGELDISKNSISGSDTDSYDLVNSCYLKYDFLSTVQKSSIDLIESILLLPDTSFVDLDFLESTSSNDTITFEMKDNRYDYSLFRKYKSNNDSNLELNLSILSKMYLNNDKLFNYTITYNYSLTHEKQSQESNKDGQSNESNGDISFSLELTGNSKYERKECKEKEFEFINLVNSN